MLNFVRQSILPSVLMVMAANSFAADPNQPGDKIGEPRCTQTIDSMPGEVRQILNPLYETSPTKEHLADSAVTLEALMSEANFCRVFLVSNHEKPNAIRQYEAREWKSLHLWLTRIANFMALNAQGSMDRLWSNEYEIFAGLYELEINSPPPR